LDANDILPIECEVSSKDQEGMRKMEIKDIEATFIPDFNTILEDTYQKLKLEISHVTFLDLKSPKIRHIDEIWAKEIYGSSAESKLDEAKALLSFVASKRNI